MKTLIISYFYPPCTDGASTLMYNLCKYLPKENYTVITTKEEFGKYCWNNLGVYDKNFVLDLPAVRLPVLTNKVADRIKFCVWTIFKGLSLNIKGAVDCILAVYPDESDLFSAYVLCQLTGKPLIVYMHDLYHEVRRNAYFHLLYKTAEEKIFSAASAVIVTNEKFRDYYLRKGVKNVIVLHSCIDLNKYIQPLSQNKHFFEKRKLEIVFTGSVYGTNEDTIIYFLKAAKKVPGVEVAFYTPHKQEYLKEVNRGFISKEECFKKQRNADILFLPLSFSYQPHEEVECAFPCKILEYLAAGKPILTIAPKGSFIEEFVKEHNVGVVVNELSEEKIIAAINELKDEKKRENFGKNSARAALMFNAKIQSDLLGCILEEEANKRLPNKSTLRIQPALGRKRAEAFSWKKIVKPALKVHNECLQKNE